MTTRSKLSHATVIARDQALIDGLTLHAATLPAIMLAGKTIPTPGLIAVLQARIAAIRLSIAAQAAYLDTVAALRTELADTAALVSGARQMLKIALAGQLETLGDLGLKGPKVPEPLTTEQKAAAVAKRLATRKARGTMGPKQRAKVTGESPGPAKA